MAQTVDRGASGLRANLRQERCRHAFQLVPAPNGEAHFSLKCRNPPTTRTRAVASYARRSPNDCRRSRDATRWRATPTDSDRTSTPSVPSSFDVPPGKAALELCDCTSAGEMRGTKCARLLSRSNTFRDVRRRYRRWRVNRSSGLSAPRVNSTTSTASPLVSTVLHTCTPTASCDFGNIIVLTLHLTHNTSDSSHSSARNRRSPFRHAGCTSPDGGGVWTVCCRTCATRCGR